MFERMCLCCVRVRVRACLHAVYCGYKLDTDIKPCFCFSFASYLLRHHIIILFLKGAPVPLFSYLIVQPCVVFSLRVFLSPPPSLPLSLSLFIFFFYFSPPTAADHLLS